jgi:hypothetical protein
MLKRTLKVAFYMYSVRRLMTLRWQCSEGAICLRICHSERCIIALQQSICTIESYGRNCVRGWDCGTCCCEYLASSRFRDSGSRAGASGCKAQERCMLKRQHQDGDGKLSHNITFRCISPLQY